MAKTAPSTYVPIPDGHLYPMEPITEGNAAARRGTYEFAANLNHITRRLRPVWVMSCERLLVSEQGVPGNLTLRNVWRAPLWRPDTAATPLLDVWVFAECAAGTTGTVRISTSTANLDLNVINAGNYALYSGTVGHDVTAVETLSLSMQRTGGAGDMAVCSVVIAPTDGDTPCHTGGQDVEAMGDQEPLTVHAYQHMATALTTILDERPGVAVSYSADVQRITDQFSTTTELRFLRGGRLRIAPRQNRVKVYGNGYYSGTSGAIKVWLGSMGEASAVSLALPAAGGYDASASWVDGTITIPESLSVRTDTIECKLTETGAGTSYLSGLCLWGVRV